MEDIIRTVNRALAGRAELDKMKTGEICPTQIAPVYANVAGNISPALMKWGFPGFLKPGSKAKQAPVIINARSETITQKPMFSKYWQQRCLVPANKFAEWAQNERTTDGKKAKYEFVPGDRSISLFWMAAIYRHVEGEGLPVFTILTMEAPDLMSHIHSRVPVILGNREARHAWINGEEDMSALIRQAAVRDFVFQLAAA